MLFTDSFLYISEIYSKLNHAMHGAKNNFIDATDIFVFGVPYFYIKIPYLCVKAVFYA